MKIDADYICYGKAALYCYSNTEKNIAKIDDIIYRFALSLNQSYYTTAYKQCEKVFLLQVQKKALLELKLGVNEILQSKFNQIELDYLDYKYFKRKKRDEYFDGFDPLSRSYFKKMNTIEKKFGFFLKAAGFDDEWFQETEFIKPYVDRVKDHEEAVKGKYRRQV